MSNQQKVGDPRGPGNVVPISHAAPKTRTVPFLTDDEITRLRKLLVDFDTIAVACPIAVRALSKR